MEVGSKLFTRGLCLLRCWPETTGGLHDGEALHHNWNYTRAFCTVRRPPEARPNNQKVSRLSWSTSSYVLRTQSANPLQNSPASALHAPSR